MTASVTSSASLSDGPMRPLPAARRMLRRFFQEVIGLHIQCGSKGVQIGIHDGLRVRRLGSNADPGHPSARTRAHHAEQRPWN
jgi:hypothetical protein